MSGPPAPESGAVVYCVSLPGPEGELELGRFEVRDRIRTYAIVEDTPIRVKGTEQSRRAGDFPELKRYFELAKEGAKRKLVAPTVGQAAAALPPESCRNHADQIPTYACITCGAMWCAACVIAPAPGSRMPPLCPLERDFCRPVVYERPAEPLLERAASSLTYPFAAGGLLYLFFYCVLRAIGSLWAFFPPATFGFLIFLFIAWIYDLEIVRASANGQRTVPSWPEVDDIWSTMARGIKVLAVTILCWSPFWLCTFWAVGRIADRVSQGPGGGGLLARVVEWSVPYLLLLILVGLLCYSYFWMCLGYAAVWDRVIPALNPAMVAGSIRACGTDYLLFLALAIGSAIVVGFAGFLFAFIPLVGRFLAIPIEAALSFWLLHLLGWMLHRHQVDLGWD